MQNGVVEECVPKKKQKTIILMRNGRKLQMRCNQNKAIDGNVTLRGVAIVTKLDGTEIDARFRTIVVACSWLDCTVRNMDMLLHSKCPQSLHMELWQHCKSKQISTGERLLLPHQLFLANMTFPAGGFPKNWNRPQDCGKKVHRFTPVYNFFC